jgi:uncharacterized repeat protein (TIGR03803 family)
MSTVPLRLCGVAALLAALCHGASDAGAEPSFETLWATKAELGYSQYTKLARARNGVLYGVGIGGGRHGDGFIYELKQGSAEEEWKRTVIHHFRRAYPGSGVVIGASGELYGVDEGSGTSHGRVYRLSPPSETSKDWRFDTLFVFDGQNGDTPHTELTLDADGAVFGTTEYGGKFNCGTVFKLSPRRGGGLPWAHATIADMKWQTGCNPSSPVVFNEDGAIFGTARAGGLLYGGTVFRIVNLNGNSQIDALAQFDEDGPGRELRQDIVIDSEAHIIGAAQLGGSDNCGYIYRVDTITLNAPIEWLHDFKRKEGCQPNGLAIGPEGAIYGTALSGGRKSRGAIFKLRAGQSGKTAWTFSLLHSFDIFGRPVPPPIKAGKDAIVGTTDSEGSVWRLIP